MMFKMFVWYIFLISALAFCSAIFMIYVGSYTAAFGYVLISGWMFYMALRGRRIYKSEGS